jgi:transcriptional regulator with XRE-family HTH domain
MTFREALEREIASQALSVADIAEISGVSKGAIYNILNGKTEEDRIRPATRRALAKGCGRELEVLEDGGTLFVDPSDEVPRQVTPDITLQILSARPFLEDGFFSEPFDWLHGLEEKQVVSGLDAVDRVFQRREEFLSLAIENRGDRPISEARFDLKVTYSSGAAAAQFALKWPMSVAPGQRAERTLFLGAGPAFDLEIINPVCADEKGESRGLEGPLGYVHKG